MKTIEEFIEQNGMHFSCCWVAMDKDVNCGKIVYAVKETVDEIGSML